MRALIALLALGASIYAAQAFGLGEGNRFGKLGAFSKNGTGGGGGGSGFVLRTDGSYVLRTDGSKICRAGGC